LWLASENANTVCHDVGGSTRLPASSVVRGPTVVATLYVKYGLPEEVWGQRGRGRGHLAEDGVGAEAADEGYAREVVVRARVLLSASQNEALTRTVLEATARSGASILTAGLRERGWARVKVESPAVAGMTIRTSLILSTTLPRGFDPAVHLASAPCTLCHPTNRTHTTFHHHSSSLDFG
jgi:hypothetical protein